MPQNPARWSQNIGFGRLQEGVEKRAESEEEREILIQMFVDCPTRRRQIIQKRLAMRMETHKMENKNSAALRSKLACRL